MDPVAIVFFSGSVVFCVILLLALYSQHKVREKIITEHNLRVKEQRPTEQRLKGKCPHCGYECERWIDECNVFVTPHPNIPHHMYDTKNYYIHCPNQCGLYMIEHIVMEHKGWEVRPTEMEELGQLIDEVEKTNANPN